jgi:two-component system, OmpR family, response regulator
MVNIDGVSDEQTLLNLTLGSPGSASERIGPKRVILKIEGCQFDLAAYAFVQSSGREVSLTRAEAVMLAALVTNPCRVLSREELRCAIVGHEAESATRSVDMTISRLRRKIEPYPKEPQFIVSVRGVGYKFAVKPQTSHFAAEIE